MRRSLEPDGASYADAQQQLAWSQEIPDYGNKLLKRLDNFRKTTILYDVCIHTQNGDFNAHKVILAACGGIFRTCFVDEKKKMISSTTELTLECPAQGLKPIIRFAYTGALVVTKRNAIATMIAAEVTKMKEQSREHLPLNVVVSLVTTDVCMLTPFAKTRLRILAVHNILNKRTVQEICADIAFKEYGWIATYSGDKTEALIESLGNVLQLHSACFIANSVVNGESEASVDKEFPFETEVKTKYSEHTVTYRNLVVKLFNAKEIVHAVTARKAKMEEKINGTSHDSGIVLVVNENGSEAIEHGTNSSDDSSGEGQLSKVVVPKTIENTEPSRVEARKKPKRDIPPPTPRTKPPTHPVNVQRSNVKLDSGAKGVSENDQDTISLPPQVVGDAEIPKSEVQGLTTSDKATVRPSLADVNSESKSTVPHVVKRKDLPPPSPRARQSAHQKPENSSKVPDLLLKTNDKEKDCDFQAKDTATEEHGPPKRVPPPPAPRSRITSQENVDETKHEKSSTMRESPLNDQSPVPSTVPQTVKAPRKDVPPPSPRAKPLPQDTSAKPRNVIEAVENGKTISPGANENGNVLVQASSKIARDAPSPPGKVQLRSSVKVKKAPPPPPSPSPLSTEKANASEKPVTKSAPPRPTKAPAKVPPPRPKPPVKKKLSSETSVPANTTKEATDYDDALNPFV